MSPKRRFHAAVVYCTVCWGTRSRVDWTPTGRRWASTTSVSIWPPSPCTTYVQTPLTGSGWCGAVTRTTRHISATSSLPELRVRHIASQSLCLSQVIKSIILPQRVAYSWTIYNLSSVQHSVGQYICVDRADTLAERWRRLYGYCPRCRWVDNIYNIMATVGIPKNLYKCAISAKQKLEAFWTRNCFHQGTNF